MPINVGFARYFRSSVRDYRLGMSTGLPDVSEDENGYKKFRELTELNFFEHEEIFEKSSPNNKSRRKLVESFSSTRKVIGIRFQVGPVSTFLKHRLMQT